VLVVVDRNGGIWQALIVPAQAGIVPKALPCSLDYKLVMVGVPYAVDHFQHLRNEDSREKPRSETLAIHLESEYGSS
jgi:hypothetical protein